MHKVYLYAFLDFEMSAEQGFYVYFGSGIIILPSELPKDRLLKHVSWTTEMSCGKTFQDIHPEIKRMITDDLALLHGIKLLSGSIAEYFIKQKTKDIWIFGHEFSGKTFSSTDIDDFVPIVEFEITDPDLKSCQNGMEHHFKLLPCIYSNATLVTKYKVIDTTGWEEDSKSTLLSLKNELYQVLNGAILRCNAKQFSYSRMPGELQIFDESVKRERLLFCLNMLPKFENHSSSEFNSSLSFVENISALRINNKSEYPFILRGIPDILYRKESVITTSMEDDLQHIVIEAKHFSVASTLSKTNAITLALPRKLGELISQLYVVSCSRLLLKYMQRDRFDIEECTAVGLFYSSNQFYKCQIKIGFLDRATAIKCSLMQLDPTSSLEVLCYMFNSL